ncbi:hypothetical protein BC834DRAFT_839943 [Gloeopeniophorella convolvens]|nr:hypothetical protein BC834DRAFT_839943 [Gloeopeniophorella convolvens]
MPPPLDLPFHGLSSVTSFLASSAHKIGTLPTGGQGKETGDGRLNFRIINGVKYDAYPRNEIPYRMLKDAVNPRSEQYSDTLLRKLTENGSPSFLDLPDLPFIRNALNLGCRDRHWVLHAAQSWKTRGTKVTGVDLSFSSDVDTNPETEPSESGSPKDNVRLLHHNFIREKLPFKDNSFDYVRLANTSVVIPRTSWGFVLSEVHRVLAPGGRFELIHDQLCFSSIGPENDVNCSFEPGHEPDCYSRRPDNTTNGKGDDVKGAKPPPPRRAPYQDWKDEMKNCSDVERLYLEMLARLYGVHPKPQLLFVEVIRNLFGGGGLVKISNVHVCLPSQDFMTRSRPPTPAREEPKRSFPIVVIDWGQDKDEDLTPRPSGRAPTPPERPPLRDLPSILSKKAASMMGVTQLSPVGVPYQQPGIVVARTSSDNMHHPITFLPMSPSELDMHANKHVHSLLSSKEALEAHLQELQELGEPGMSLETLSDVLWRYELFRRKRFNWPSPSGLDGDDDDDDQTESTDSSKPDRPRSFPLPDTHSLDGLTPVRLFEIFEVIKPAPKR